MEIPYVLFETIYYTLIVYAMVEFEWAVGKFFYFFLVTFLTLLYFTYYGMMTVAITPNFQIASIVAASFYMIFNLFCGFFIPRPVSNFTLSINYLLMLNKNAVLNPFSGFEFQRMPKWWTWYYWICPVSWTVYGLIIGQFGDLEDTISVTGSPLRPMIKDYIQDHYGYDPNFHGEVVAALIGFSVLFAVVYAFCIKTLNFQMR